MAEAEKVLLLAVVMVDKRGGRWGVLPLGLVEGAWVEGMDVSQARTVSTGGRRHVTLVRCGDGRRRMRCFCCCR